ncbi:hypothetical protein J0895_12510 [Phormidium pseudopriestleyi FRX01]|uniref:Uncharacterized protein n=1 Tax=Phormidium pseudopriestleyi FRX01 TaxID=1759528 RepID=A0ABS3FS18_9CYAN|nr:hypothetical protein [Phormidium pseudopriestleyi]MBO0349920.1 hypothetical protein [Phormidium pseudopriestleyi FRX01]
MMKTRYSCFYDQESTPLDTLGLMSPKIEFQSLPRHCCVHQAARSPQLPRLNSFYNLSISDANHPTP